MDLWSLNWHIVGLACAALLARGAGTLLKKNLWMKSAWVAAEAIPFAIALCSIFLWMPASQKPNLHDVYHYRTEALYLRELGYDFFYRCQIAASPDASQPKSYRSQANYLVQPYSMSALQECKDRLGLKWEPFVKDAAIFGAIVGAPGGASLVLDHGYNAPPFWAALHNPWISLTSLDAVQSVGQVVNQACLVLSLVFLGLAFGWGSAGLVVTTVLTMPLLQSGWLASSPGRLDWLLFSCISLFFANKSAWRWAGVFAGLAGGLRVFPLAGFVLAALAAMFYYWRHTPENKLAIKEVLIGLAWAVGVFFLCLGIGVGVYGLDITIEWFRKISLHSSFYAWNNMGSLGVVILGVFVSGNMPNPPLLALWWLIPFAVMAAATMAAIWLSPHKGLPFAISSGFGAMFWLGEGISNYYWIAAIILTGVIRRSSWPCVFYLALSVAAGVLFSMFPEQRLGLLPLVAAFSSATAYVWQLTVLLVASWTGSKVKSMGP